MGKNKFIRVFLFLLPVFGRPSEKKRIPLGFWCKQRSKVSFPGLSFEDSAFNTVGFWGGNVPFFKNYAIFARK